MVIFSLDRQTVLYIQDTNALNRVLYCS